MAETSGFGPIRKSMVDYHKPDPTKRRTTDIWLFGKSGSRAYSYTFDSVLQDFDAMTARLDRITNDVVNHKASVWKFVKTVTHELAHASLGDHLKERITEMKEQGKNVVILDVMGYGGVLRALDVAGVSVALSDPRTQAEKDDDATHNRVLIPGDILSSKTWKKIKTYMDSRNIRFDAILCRPLGALSEMPTDLGIQKVLLDRMYPLLNPDGGFLVTQIHPQNGQAIKTFSEHINAVPGILSRSTSVAFMLARTKGSPQSLPA